MLLIHKFIGLPECVQCLPLFRHRQWLATAGRIAGPRLLRIPVGLLQTTDTLTLPTNNMADVVPGLGAAAAKQIWVDYVVEALRDAAEAGKTAEERDIMRGQVESDWNKLSAASRSNIVPAINKVRDAEMALAIAEDVSYESAEFVTLDEYDQDDFDYSQPDH